MESKWTPERAKRESKEKVLKALALKSPQRWSELLENTKQSSKTLKNALDRMKIQGLIYRQVETESGYPPPVLYGLTSEGKESVKPRVFATKVGNYVMGFSSHKWSEPEGMDQEVQVIVTPKSDFKGKNSKQIMAEIGKRVGALYLYVFLKTLEEGSLDWIDTTLNRIIDVSSLILQFGQSLDIKGLEEIRLKTKEKDLVGWVVARGKAEVKVLDEEHAILRMDWDKISLPEIRGIHKLQSLLKEVYPEEVEMFDNILEKASKG